VAPSTRPSVNKRLREASRKERQLAKAERRAQRAAERQNKAATVATDEDPDIAGIVPGPQPRPWEDDEPEEPKV
jgi:hypothetical protein